MGPDSSNIYISYVTCKENGATLNDLLLTAYLRVLSRNAAGTPISIPCPVDLRKYINKENQARLGICNLTSNYYVRVKVEKDESFEGTLQKVSKQMSKQKQSLACLKGPILLNLVYHLLPRRMMQRLFFKLFTIPVVSYTNLGVIDNSRLRFEGAVVQGCYMTGAIKHVPYFQISFSSYDGMGTISCNLYGTNEDRKWIVRFLEEMAAELIEL